MYDNNYPNTNQATDSTGTDTTTDATVMNSGGNITSGDNSSSLQNRDQGWNRNHNPYGGQHHYYQNVYRDSAYTQNTNQSPYENRATSYQYGNTYPNDYTQINQRKEKKPDKKKRESGGYLKKALICISLGLFFGVFAGVGFYAVQSVNDLLGGNARKESVSELETTAGDVVNETAGIINETAQKIKETASAADASRTDSGIHVTDSITTVVSDVSGVVKEVMPAIVSINNHYRETMSYWGQSFVNEADASGSGIIVGENDTELLIVTNYHVIADTERLTVQFVEGSEVEAAVKGTDADMDLAVIAVSINNINSSTMKEIAIATLGDSDSLEVGEPAIAIGNSLGYGQSVTTGVISALNRSIELSDGSDGTFIQTDAAINPGNSGGALLNMKGEVIGINSNKIGGSAIEGMGYAIPISSASPIIAELMLKETKNKVAEEERGYLGISGINVTEDVSRMYGIPEGVFIYQVYEHTAASDAGLQKGDIITEFEGEKITSMDDLQEELQFYAKGDTVEVTVMSASNNGYVSRKVQLTLGNKV